MRKIIFVFLFFCLAITTVLAQVVTTNIAAPDSNGLSDNPVADFDVDTGGTILNNSAVDGTAQLIGTDGTSTDVTANPDIVIYCTLKETIKILVANFCYSPLEACFSVLD